MSLIFLSLWIWLILLVKVVPFKMVPFRSFTTTEVLFPVFVAILEDLFRNTIQLVAYTFLDIIKSVTLMSFQGFGPGEKKNRRDWNLAYKRAEVPQECYFLPRIHWWRLPCDRMRCRDATSKCMQCHTLSTLSFVLEVGGLPTRASFVFHLSPC